MGMELENRMISAEWLKTRCYEICEEYNTEHLYIDRIIDEIDNAPDVEVVRCKDCKYCDPENHHCDHYTATILPLPRKLDGYCSYGERKDND